MGLGKFTFLFQDNRVKSRALETEYEALETEYHDY